MSYISLAQISGDVTISNGISTIGANRVTLAMLATIPNNTVLLNVSGGAAVPIAGTGANVRTICGLATTDTPTFAGLTLTNLAALTTPAESWVGPSSTAGIYFKSGNVGIGTTTPAHKLDIYGITGDTVLAVGKTFGAGAAPAIYTIASAAGYFTGSAEGVIETRTNHPLVFGTNDAEVMRLLPGGNVGIGTTAPGQKLDVTGSIRAVAEGMTLGNTSGGIIAQRTSDDSELYFGYRSVPDAFVIGASYSTNGVYKPLILATSDTARMTILTNGNVGIGTTSPQSKLSVVGLPTSASGLTSGDIWCDTTGGLNILKIV